MASNVAAEVQLLENRVVPTITYHGGPLLQNVEAQNVFLGSDYNTNPSLVQMQSQLDGFTSTIVSGPYMDMLTNGGGYGVGRGTSSPGVVNGIVINKQSGILDSQIQSNLQTMITNHQLQTPDANRLYIVFVEPNVEIYDGKSNSHTDFLGYHWYFSGHTANGVSVNVQYAVISYPGGPNFTDATLNVSSDKDFLTQVASHEIAESVTDPTGTGWYDDTKAAQGKPPEIGDMLSWGYSTYVATRLDTYEVQDLVDKNGGLMAPLKPAIVTAAVQAHTVTLTWTGFKNAQGYIILKYNNSTHIWEQIGIVGPSTNTFSFKPAALGQKYFIVRDYMGSNYADSQVLSVNVT